ncbi:MAG: hypothetical protein RR275_05040 [Lachnospiraceae bacterium]
MGKIRKKFRQMGKALRMEMKEHKSSFIVFLVLRAAVILTLILETLNGNFENVFLCILTLLLLVVPSFIQMEFKIELPTVLEIFILIFIFAAEILGEISSFYVKIPIWDTVLHTINGFLAAAIGFSLVDLLNGNEKIQFKLSPIFMAVVAFCFSMSIGVIWEFFEFGMDSFFHMDMQKDTIIHSIQSVKLNPTGQNIPIKLEHIKTVIVNGHELGLKGYLDIGLVDTMKDLLVNFVGAIIFSVIGFFYVKSRGKNTIISRFIPRMKDNEADFLKHVKDEEEKEELLELEKSIDLQKRIDK